MIVVLGGVRSGSSVVARMLHNLGVVMGSAQAFPLPGMWHDDFEDFAIARGTTEAFTTGRMPKVRWFEEYIDSRLGHCEAMRGLYPEHIQGCGVKGQLLGLYYDQMRRAADRSGTRLRLVVAVREPEDVEASIARVSAEVRADARQAWFEQMCAMNERIVQAINGLESTVRVRFAERKADPKATAERLCARLGLAWRDRALEGVL